MLILINNAMTALMGDLNIDSYSQNYILKRLASEGIKFLTVELVKVSKALIASLETGRFQRDDLTSFKYKGAILHLFEELISRVFDFRTGILLTHACSMSIGMIRQVAEYLYKLALEFSDEQEHKAFENFQNNEEILEAIGTNPKVLEFANQLRKDFETFYPDISRKETYQILSNYRPRQTNGTFIGGGDHFYFDRIANGSIQRLTSMEGYAGYFKPYPASRVKVTVSATSDYSELLLVPKDSRGPRTICREDRVRLETQMSFFDFMVDNLTRISDGAINFRDQTVNRRVAEESSVTKSYCTLDLKDASDMVSVKIIKTIFSQSPGCLFFVTGDRRASKVKIGSSFRKLNKLSGMGSGLTFPTMSLLISLAICNKVRRRYPSMDYSAIRRKIYVYGDDICCPTEWYAIAVDALALIGLKVNVTKSFVNSHFRESCGGDYYKGIDITPTRLKLQSSGPKVVDTMSVFLPDSPNSFKQLYEHSKECYAKGLIRLSKYYMGVLKRAHLSMFNSPMVAGRFDKDLGLFVDYTKGTDHLPVGRLISAYTVVPLRHGSSSIIDEDGNLLERCPYRYLSSSFNREVQNLLDIKTPSSFDEVTIPRRLKFVKQRMLSDFILPFDLAFSRSHFEELVQRERTVEVFSSLIVWTIFDAAVRQLE